MGRFTLPRDLYHGKGSLAELKNLKGKKAIIVVGGGSMKRGGFLGQAEEYLKEAGMEVKLFEGVESDPSVETVMRGAKMMQEFEPDWIVAMGGGSPIDAAKTMWAFYEYPDTTFEDLITPLRSRSCARKLISVLSPPHPEQQRRLPLLQLSRTIRRVLNILWQTLTLRPTLPSLILTLRRQCLRSW